MLTPDMLHRLREEFKAEYTAFTIPLSDIIAALKEKRDLAEQEIVSAMCQLSDPVVPEDDIAAYLSALHHKGETELEIATSARFLRACAERPYSTDDESSFKTLPLIDCCGTGGGVALFNISTIVGFVLAASGLYVAKHGNRAITSSHGSADLLEAWGATLVIPNQCVARCIQETHIGFLFAPQFHTATKNVQPVRKKLPHKTIFNILGPLTNPAHPQYQVTGVFDPHYPPILIHVLKRLGLRSAYVFCGMTDEGKSIDEVSTMGPTVVAELLPSGHVREYEFAATAAGIAVQPYHLFAKRIPYVASFFTSLLQGKAQGSPEEDLVVINAAFGLQAGGKVRTITEGVHQARSLIKSGACYEVVQRFVQFTRSCV